MKDLKIAFRCTRELSEEDIVTINSLKNQHWKYTAEDHMRWFKQNIQPEDVHLMLWGYYGGGGYCLLAYLNLVHVDVEIDNQSKRMFGIGNVCVSKDREHSGIGTILMVAANAYIKEIKSCGLLLCHDDTIGFYETCGWKTFDAERVKVAGDSFKQNVMVYDPSRSVFKATQLVFDRSF